MFARARLLFNGKEVMVQSIAFFGLGKLGLPLASHFASSGLRTLAIDCDAGLISRLSAGACDFEEPGLGGLFEGARPYMQFHTSASEAGDVDASIILVPTPSSEASPSFSSAFVEQVCDDICAGLKSRPVWQYHLIVVSSTLFPGTMAKLAARAEAQLGRPCGPDFGLVYVPDFVALGDVVRGFKKPAFLLVGSDDRLAAEKTITLYERFLSPNTVTKVLPAYDAEIAKVAANAFLCMKISFGNFLAQLCHGSQGVNLNGIAEALTCDSRIGSGLLQAGTPYGGPCFPRDVSALVHLAKINRMAAPLAEATARVNEDQYALIEAETLSCSPQRVGMLGLSFKPGSSVVTESPSFELTRRLKRRGIDVVGFDFSSQARQQATSELGIDCANLISELVERVDTIILCHHDARFRGIAAMAPPTSWIIDPWGCIEDHHTQLLRPGRRPLGNQSRAVTE